jgi:ABC-type spermidine/putrescine transport system permease subunit I
LWTGLAFPYFLGLFLILRCESRATACCMTRSHAKWNGMLLSLIVLDLWTSGVYRR